jgi:hypothetical protein
LLAVVEVVVFVVQQVMPPVQAVVQVVIAQA